MGRVYFIGAGSGDPELLTVKGKRILEQADVIIYDRLAHPIFLSLAKPSAAFIYCGKLPYAHSLKQQEINQKLLHFAQKDQIVVRLKGGDPSIFGRISEEVQILEENQITYEVIPGISAAMAASSYAGFPLTDRELSSRVTFATAHRQSSKEKNLEIAPLVSGGTLCFYMGIENLTVICSELLARGIASNMPVAMVEWATLGRQRSVFGTLATIEEEASKQRIKNPAIILIGKVVLLKKEKSWFETLPLFSKKLLLVSSTKIHWETYTHYTSLGADVYGIEVGEKRDTRFDSQTQRYLQEQAFTTVLFLDEQAKENYEKIASFLELPERYFSLEEFSEKDGVEKYGIV